MIPVAAVTLIIALSIFVACLTNDEGQSWVAGLGVTAFSVMLLSLGFIVGVVVNATP